MRTEDQARKGRDGGFTDVELFFDKKRGKGKKRGEDSDTSVSNVCFFNLDGLVRKRGEQGQETYF